VNATVAVKPPGDPIATVTFAGCTTDGGVVGPVGLPYGATLIVNESVDDVFPGGSDA
jgi:hypothetical protein